MRKLRKPVKIAGGLILLGAVVGSVLTFHQLELKLTLHGDTIYRQQVGEAYDEPGAEAYVESNLFPFLNKELEVTSEGSVDSEENGTYVIQYHAAYGNNSITKEREVIVKDYIPPEITLETIEGYYTPYNHAYQEEGYSAIDNLDGDVSENVHSYVTKDYVLYTVRDSQNNYRTVMRTIHYDDQQAPQIYFQDGGGMEEVRLFIGEPYNPNYYAVDDSEDDVTDRVQVEGSVNTNAIGDYAVTYTVSDSYDHTTSITRVVHVVARPRNISSNEDSRTIYLTFDDGPAAPTQGLLDILDRYGVKATFFTTSTHGYANMIGEEFRRGHTVAVHTYTHNYATVYASVDAYWNDFNNQNQVVYAQTGQYSDIFRFPGGSSNTVSASYTSGIMTTLVQQANDKGLRYFDWNVSSGDGGGLEDTDAIYNNIITGIQNASANGRPSVVLQHDTKQSSMDAVERVIQWGLENGYHFERLSPGSYTAHHGVNN